MKKKPRTKKRTTRRKSRMGAASQFDFTNLLAVVAGAAGAKFIDKFIPSTIDPKMVNGGKIVLGAVLPMLAKDGKTKSMLQGAGAGFMAVGAVGLFQNLNILSGAKDNDMVEVTLSGVETVLAGMDDLRLPVINGAEDNRLPVINGSFEKTVLAGDDEDISIINGYVE